MFDYHLSQLALEKAYIIPGRSLVRSKMPGKLFAPDSGPLYASTASGAMMVDVDGHTYIDMICGLGAISIGHGVGPTVISRRMAGALSVLGLPTRSEARAGEAVLDHVAPWATRVRFTKTGSEATHAAYRIAKRVTGRSIVLMGDWAYHGWHEWCERRPNGEPESPFTEFYPHESDFQKYLDVIEIQPKDVAAIFIEPHRFESVSPKWLLDTQLFCRTHGILLVFDEMIYGGRWALGGASEYYRVTPDMACYGKALGNGDAVACVVGGQALDDAGTLVSGTYSGDLVGLESILATIDYYAQNNVIEHLWDMGQKLQDGLNAGLLDVPGCGGVLRGRPVHQQLHFATITDQQLFGAEMAARGVLWHPDVVNVCYSHTAEDIEKVVVAAQECMKLVKQVQQI